MSRREIAEGGSGAGVGAGFSGATPNAQDPQPRVIADFENNFFANSEITPTHLGRAAELLVCFEFVMRGFDALVNDFPSAPADVLAVVQGKIVRVQVKSTGEPGVKTKRNNKPGRTVKTELCGYASRRQKVYRFNLRGGAQRYRDAGIDLFAFVALDLRTVMYLPATGIAATAHKRFGAATFAQRAAGSFERALAEVLG